MSIQTDAILLSLSGSQGWLALPTNQRAALVQFFPYMEEIIGPELMAEKYTFSVLCKAKLTFINHLLTVNWPQEAYATVTDAVRAGDVCEFIVMGQGMITDYAGTLRRELEAASSKLAIYSEKSKEVLDVNCLTERDILLRSGAPDSVLTKYDLGNLTINDLWSLLPFIIIAWQ